MNKEEKKALWSFLSIYVISSTIFMMIIAYMYFDKEIKMVKMHYKMNLGQEALQIKADILETHMKHKKYTFKSKNDEYKYAILSQNDKFIYSNLKYPDEINLNKEYVVTENKNQYLVKIDDKNINIKYVIVEDITWNDKVDKMKFIIYVALFLGLLIMLFIGYILSKILLKPVHQKSEQLNRFVKDSSHELNTPITALTMIIPSLKSKYAIEDKTITQLSASVKNIKQTYDKLLFNINGDIIIRYDEAFDLKEIVNENILFFEEIAKSKNIKLHSNISNTPIYMDKYSANMIVNNLMSNAIKYSRKRKNINITLNNHILEVKDEGIGMSLDVQDTIFVRYKRGTKEEGGFGIGLDIVSSVCKDYNIEISLSSKENEGTTFLIDFNKITYKED
jgi:two-component system OmpR family sensor kinase